MRKRANKKGCKYEEDLQRWSNSADTPNSYSKFEAKRLESSLFIFPTKFLFYVYAEFFESI